MGKQYFDNFNDKYKNRYNESLEKIKEIITELNVSDKYKDYFQKAGNRILEMAQLEQNLNDEFFDSKTFDELKKFNHNLYKGVIGENYKTSYANPSYCIEQFGDETGHALMYLYTKIFNYIQPAFEHEIVTMTRYNELFIKFYKVIDLENQEQLKAFVREHEIQFVDDKVEMNKLTVFDPDFDTYTKIIIESDLKDLRYLFRFGKYISDNEITSARHLLSLSREKVEKMAAIEVKAFKDGYADEGLDLSNKKTIIIYYQLGFERLAKKVIKSFKEIGLEPMMFRDPFHAQRLRMISTRENPQYSYDHKFDHAFFYNEDYAESYFKAIEKTGNKHHDVMNGFAGPALQESFGQKAFSPKNDPYALKLTMEQATTEKNLNSKVGIEMNKHIPRSEYSFVITTYPLPEIGEDYENIFESVIEINSLDSDKFEEIQAKIIDALDEGDHVHIKGTNGNETDIVVNLHELKDAEKETIFENCIATVNVPVGEVFTSPTLKGTNGLLHVSEVFLQGLKYENLKISFEEGYTKDYSCTNFDNDKEGEKFIYDNLLHPNKSLPLGEFAIGTNTFAYVMGKKYGIENLMPILIAEKTGPHFAIGDTCFSWSEDNKVYNRNGKEIIARDNEHSICRLEDPAKAYTYKHTDITIPYDELGEISVVKSNGERISIIIDGRFVLEGTEFLNTAFRKIANYDNKVI